MIKTFRKCFPFISVVTASSYIRLVIELQKLKPNLNLCGYDCSNKINTQATYA